MASRDPEYYDYALDPEAWPEFMRAGLIPAPPSGQPDMWPDAAASAAPVDASNASMPAGLMWPMMPRQPQQAPDQNGAAALFMQSGMMPAPPSARAPMLAADTAPSPADEASQAQAARFGAARQLGQWGRRGTQEYAPPAPPPSPSRDAEIPYLNRMNGAEPYLKRPDGSIVFNPAAWAPAIGRDPSRKVYVNPDAWGQMEAQGLELLGMPTRNLRGIVAGEPAPPPPPLPDTPQKIPSRDPRAANAQLEMANIAAHAAAAVMPEAAAAFLSIPRAAALMPEAVAEIPMAGLGWRYRAPAAEFPLMGRFDMPVPIPPGMRLKEPPPLPMDQASRMKRAEELGFDLNEPLYHGAATEFGAFDPAMLGRSTQAPSARAGHWSALHPELAGGFADNAAQRSGGNPQIYPLLARSDEPGVLKLTGRETEFDVAAAIMHAFDSGFDKILVEYPKVPGGMSRDAVVVKNPNQYRSAFAQFDPAKRDSPDLSAAIAGVGILGPYFAGSMLPVRK